MKQAKQRARQQKIKPRVGVVALLKKGGLHQRKDKRASRARQKMAARQSKRYDGVDKD